MHTSRAEALTDDRQTPAQPTVSVRVAAAEIATLHPVLNLVGTIVAIPEKTAVISPQLGGWVSKLDVVEGQSVSVGERLVSSTQGRPKWRSSVPRQPCLKKRRR